MKHYIQIKSGHDQMQPAPDEWTEWEHGGTGAELRMIAAKKYLREMGFEKSPITRQHVFTVHHYDNNTPTHPNGRPRRCHSVTMIATPTRETVEV